MNKYVVFCSLLSIHGLITKKKEFKSDRLIKAQAVNDSFKLSNSFLSDYSFFLRKFIQSSLFKKEWMIFKDKKADQFFDENKNFGKASCEFKKNEPTELKLSFPIVPVLESFLNFSKKGGTHEFLESKKDSLSDFLNKIYELRVKKWVLSKIESEINLCYSELKNIKNPSVFEELNDRVEDLFEVVNDLKQDVNALEEEMQSRWGIEKSTWLNSELHSSFNFVLSFLNEDGLSSLKSGSNLVKKENKINLSFFSVDFNLKINPEIKTSFSISFSLINFLNIFCESFKNKDSLDISLKNNFENLKNIRKIRISIRKISKKMRKYQILKQKTSKMTAFDKENAKKNIEAKLNYVEECLEYSNELESLFALIVLYKKNNNDLIYDCNALLGEKI